MAIFEGAGVALVTPFKENGSVNYEVLESLIEEQIAGGTDCIVAMGTTGESATTSEEEHIQVIRFVCEVVNGRIPVVAGTGSNCTQTAVELSVEAEEAGADGVLLVSPYSVSYTHLDVYKRQGFLPGGRKDRICGSRQGKRDPRLVCRLCSGG